MFLSIVLALMTAAGVALLFLGIMKTLQKESDFEQRLDAVMGRRLPSAQAADGEKGPGAGQAMASAVEKALVKRGFGAKVQESLSRADVKLTVGEFMMIRLATAVIGFPVGYVAGLFNTLIEGVPIPFAVGGALIGYLGPGMWVGNRAKGRIAAFNNQLADTIGLIANGLRSGNSAAQAMALAAREAPPPTNGEFARVVQEMGLGIPPEEAFQNLVRRMPSEDLDMMVTAMNVSAEVGGNLAEVLEKIGETIRQRVTLKGDVATLTAQQQGAGYIISALPAIIAGVMFLLNGAYVKPMFAGFPYLCLPICAGLMIFTGFMAMKKITDIKV